MYPTPVNLLTDTIQRGCYKVGSDLLTGQNLETEGFGHRHFVVVESCKCNRFGEACAYPKVDAQR